MEVAAPALKGGGEKGRGNFFSAEKSSVAVRLEEEADRRQAASSAYVGPGSQWPQPPRSARSRSWCLDPSISLQGAGRAPQAAAATGTRGQVPHGPLSGTARHWGGRAVHSARDKARSPARALQRPALPFATGPGPTTTSLTSVPVDTLGRTSWFASMYPGNQPGRCSALLTTLSGRRGDLIPRSSCGAAGNKPSNKCNLRHDMLISQVKYKSVPQSTSNREVNSSWGSRGRLHWGDGVSPGTEGRIEFQQVIGNVEQKKGTWA